jgi:Fungal specific transcription factor domain
VLRASLKDNLLTFVFPDVTAWCKGRTILYHSNSFLKDVTAMCAGSPAVRHAVFALAATYILDYEPLERLVQIADKHHRRAVRLLGEQLQNPDKYAPGNEDALLATIFLLSHDDV